MTKKIMAALSGGVDSSVAAALLKDRGYEVIGAAMELHDNEVSGTAVEDAGRVAEKLAIPFYVFDFRDIFTGTIIDYFCNEYTHGRTPNPCVLCNRFIKFGMLWEKARELGADYLATGHYAGIAERDGLYLLKKGADTRKDQSYFLYRLTQEQLSRTLLPLAALDKEQVRKIAAEFNLPAIDREESQEICFVPDDDYAQFVENYSASIALPGPILNSDGKTIGQHHGITHYTIGQRKGLGIAAPEPLFVTGIDAQLNAITVGTREEISTDKATAAGLNWITGAPPEFPLNVTARIRYRAEETPALVTPLSGNEVYIKFDTPQMAVTPGQSVVFYDGDTVIGGGIIKG